MRSRKTSYKITSAISMPWNFTTKSRGICRTLVCAPSPYLPRLGCTGEGLPCDGSARGARVLPAAPRGGGPTASTGGEPAAPRGGGPAAPRGGGPAAPRGGGPAAPRGGGPAAPRGGG